MTMAVDMLRRIVNGVRHGSVSAAVPVLYAALIGVCMVVPPLGSLNAAPETERDTFDIAKVQDALGGAKADFGNPGAAAVQDKEYSGGRESYTTVIARIIGSLMILSLVLLLGIWILKRVNRFGNRKLTGGTMDLIEALPMGQNRSILLVRIMDKVYALSQTPQHIQLIEKFEGRDAMELIASTRGGTSIQQFKDVFHSFIGKLKNNAPRGEGV